MGNKLDLKNKKKDDIVTAAAHVFSQRGYSGTSVAEIALQAGIGKGTVYEYFSSKEDLFFAVFEWYFSITTTGLTVNISALGGSATQRLEALMGLIGAAQQAGEIRAELDPAQLARSLMITFAGSAAMVKGFMPNEVIVENLEILIDSWT